jgi:hypothetical protein
MGLGSMIQRLRPLGAWQGMGTLGQSGDIVSAMAAAITQMEGYNPAFAPNNNPGNLIYIGPNQNGQSGVTRGAGGFAAFPTLAAGQAALANQIQYQVNQGQTLTQFFNQYAPGGTTNAAGGVQTSAATQNYINFVSGQLGIDPNVPLNQSSSGGTSYASDGSAIDNTSTAGIDLSTIDLSSPVVIAALVIAGAGFLYTIYS